MVLKRKRTSRKPVARRVRRRFTRGDAFRSIRAVVPAMNMKRTLYAGSWSFATTTTNDFWRYQTFTAANSMNNFAEIAALFDRYKINAIKQTWRPRYDSVQVPSAAGAIAQPQAYAHVIIDTDSETVPSGVYSQATVNGFLEQGGVKSYTLTKPFSVYWKPKINNATGNGASRIKAPFLSTANTGENHYGYHMLIQQNNMSTSNTNVILDSFITVYFTVKNLK